MKLGIIGSGKIVHDFLSIADQIPDLELAALSTTKRSHQIGQYCYRIILKYYTFLAIQDQSHYQ